MPNFLDEPVSQLPGVGGIRAALLRTELGLETVRDLLSHYPHRYVDKTLIRPIRDLLLNPDTGLVQGMLSQLEYQGAGAKKRLVAYLRDDSAVLELVWFKSGKVLESILQPGMAYTAYGKVQRFRGKATMVHPEMELARPESGQTHLTFDPVYSTTEGLTKKGLDSKGLRKLTGQLIPRLTAGLIPEILPEDILHQLRLMPRLEAIRAIHFPPDMRALEAARNRLKFEELFFVQLELLIGKRKRARDLEGYAFSEIGSFVNRFYQEFLPFTLTEAQKRVIREIRRDLGTGRHMNRLLQGDVGSGKTVVALMAMLIALDNGFQSCMVAPTEILARQHFESLKTLIRGMGIRIGILTGSVTGAARKKTLDYLASGDLHVLVGTHAVLEEPVRFRNLGLAITDEQHRFGVAQRAALWKKGHPLPPHILVMTATPIPRTLALTVYGDLDISVLDELPPGRKPVQTELWYENRRLRLIGFLKEQIRVGRQVYIVYPLIEESATLDLLNLEEGLAALERDFPKPDYQVSVVHGRMASADKDEEMRRFLKRETQIMVATTVIEVGVDVPNASVMVIENAERFGLSQLHQLRGRVGRGADQSFCILMTSGRISDDARVRLDTMCRTTNGFEIADVDLKLRGPGELEGTRQSGVPGLKIADLREDGAILHQARIQASRLLDLDEELTLPQHRPARDYLIAIRKLNPTWSRIS